MPDDAERSTHVTGLAVADARRSEPFERTDRALELLDQAVRTIRVAGARFKTCRDCPSGTSPPSLPYLSGYARRRPGPQRSGFNWRLGGRPRRTPPGMTPELVRDAVSDSLESERVEMGTRLVR
jgi:hypothetical protein